MGNQEFKLNQQVVFYKELAELLRMGFSINQALIFLKEANPNLNLVIDTVSDGLNRGDLFANSLRNLISKDDYQQLLIAERQTKLTVTLSNIARYKQLKNQQLKKLKSVIMYPIFLMICMLILSVVLNVFIIPQITNLTQKSSSISYLRFLTIGFPVILVIGGGFMYLWLTRVNPLEKCRLLLKVPVIDKLVTDYLAYYFANNLAILLKSGLTINKIIAVLQQFDKRSLLFYLGTDIKTVVSNGESLSDFIKDNRLVSNELLNFISSGTSLEETALSMEAFAKIKFEDLVVATNKFIAMVQPLLFMIIGLLIVISYLQILLPVYTSINGGI